MCPRTGRILVNGGQDSSSKTSIFDKPSVGDLGHRASTMNIPRGYQGNTVLSTTARY